MVLETRQKAESFQASCEEYDHLSAGKADCLEDVERGISLKSQIVDFVSVPNTAGIIKGTSESGKIAHRAPKPNCI